MNVTLLLLVPWIQMDYYARVTYAWTQFVHVWNLFWCLASLRLSFPVIICLMFFSLTIFVTLGSQVFLVLLLSSVQFYCFSPFFFFFIPASLASLKDTICYEGAATALICVTKAVYGPAKQWLRASVSKLMWAVTHCHLADKLSKGVICCFLPQQVWSCKTCLYPHSC